MELRQVDPGRYVREVPYCVGAWDHPIFYGTDTSSNYSALGRGDHPYHLPSLDPHLTAQRVDDLQGNGNRSLFVRSNFRGTPKQPRVTEWVSFLIAALYTRTWRVLLWEVLSTSPISQTFERCSSLINQVQWACSNRPHAHNLFLSQFPIRWTTAARNSALGSPAKIPQS